MKVIKYLFLVVCVLFWLVFFLSWFEIAINNKIPGYVYNDYNMFVNLTKLAK